MQDTSSPLKKERLIDKCPELTFSLYFTDEEWLSIEPQSKKDYPEKKILPKGWTHIIMEKICFTKKLNCPFTFKKGYVFKKTGSIKFDGFCRECGNTIVGLCDMTLDNHNFEINTRDSRSIKHFLKRPLSGDLRDKYKDYLLNNKALKCRRDEANKYMNYGEVEGPLVHGTPVLRKTRQDAIFEHYGVKPAKNIMGEIFSMKLDDKWSETIHQIGDFPFHVIFCSPEQIDLWNTISTSDNVTVSIDAAGRFVKRIRYSDEVTSHIFLYIISVSIGAKIYPLFQFISEYHAAIFIKSCFDKWIQLGAAKPKQVCTDGASGLQTAVCLAFNDCTYKEYLLSCYNKVLDIENNLPPCFLRADIAHLIKAISRWKCFEKCNPNVKDFYLRIIGYLSKITTYHDFKIIIKSVFIVCQSPGVVDGIQQNVTSLIDLIKGHQPNHCQENCSCDTCNLEHEINEESDDGDEEVGSKLNSIQKEISDIQSEALDLASNANDKNEFYCPDFIKNFSNLCAEFPIWTNIMLVYYETTILVATSGRSESLFCDLRHITNIHRPISAHLFLAIYIVFLCGTIKLAKGFIENQKLQSPALGKSIIKSSKSNVVDKDSNQLMPKTLLKNGTKPRGKYLEPSPDILIQYNRPNSKPIKDIIQNGILCRPMIYNKQIYIYKSSCLFDSIMELCGSAYCDYSYYKTTINSSCEKQVCFLSIMIDYVLTGNKPGLYKKRFQICLEYFKINNGMIYYDEPIGHLINRLFEKCAKKPFYLKLQPKSQKELLNIEKLDCYIKDHSSYNTLDLETYIFVDIQEFQENDGYNLREIPIRVFLKDKTYVLVGAIAYKQSKFNKKLQHYTTYCRSVKNNWSLKNDLAKKMMYVKDYNLRAPKIAIIMYVECQEAYE